MIPTYSHDGVLPPFLPGGSPIEPGQVSPYRAGLAEFAQRYAESTERREILEGLVAYRNALRAEGIVSGFQWLDGSFVEDCEKLRGRPPGDIDIITFSARPDRFADSSEWRAFVRSRPDLFDPDRTKEKYKCDAYFVDLRIHPVQLVAHTRYWFGLFSHQRDTFLWKGLVEVPFAESDKDVEAFLNPEVSHAS